MGNEMKDKIDGQLNVLAQAINWVNSNLNGERQQSAYDDLVAKRIQLKKIRAAIAENPAAVLYGESQQGKSYLVSSLLSTSASAFKVVDVNSGEGYDFITQINPIGAGAESTSVVTRFSIRPVSNIKGYPVKIKLLSIIDIVLILCDTYYSDLKDYIKPFKDSELRSNIELIKNKIGDVSQALIHEDEVLIMQDYFKSHFASKAPYVFDADYFRSVSKFIDKATINDIVDIFSLLWNNNSQLTTLLRNIIQQYKQIQFVKELYVPYSAILREEYNGDAILDVKRLHELYRADNQKSIQCVARVNGVENAFVISASYLCAITSEIVLQLPDDLVDEKPFLQNTDILDFPGARARLDKKEEDIVDNTLVPQMLLRGKVAYLFNKFSDNLMINTLLFCHGKKQAGPRFMPDLLKNWIESFVGKDSETRQLFMDKARIAPLFVIGTMFNLDLQKDQNDICGKTESLSARWKQRFETVYYKELFGEDCKWLDNWTSTSAFNNFYLLRDFYYSSVGQSNIYSGWTRNGGKETTEIIPEDYPNFRELLKQSFLQYPFVKKHFANAEEAWNEAASMNKDGSEYIIKNLSNAAQNINAAREDKFNRDLQEIKEKIIDEISKHYHDESSDNRIIDAKKRAGEVQAALDIAFGRDSYFFGKMMQCLILSEGDVYKIFHEEFQKADLVEKKDLSKYVYIRMKANGLSKDNDYKTNLSILARAYEMNAEDCEKFFKERGVDLLELFSGADDGMKSISQTLAELLEDYWFNQWLHGKNYDSLKQMLDEISVENMLSMLHTLYTKLGLTSRISQSIRQYVDKFGSNVDEIQEMIADMCAEKLNEFVSNVGYTYLSSDEIQALKEADEKQNLGLDFSFQNNSNQSITSQNIAEMFEAMDDLEEIKNNLDNERLQYIPGYNSRKRWSELLKIGFIQTQDIPNYDVEANKKLGEIKIELESL